MTRRLVPGLLAMAAFLAACSSDVTEPAPTDAAAVTTTGTEPATTSTSSSTTTTPVTTATEPPPALPAGGEPLPVLADGRPATWVGVTTDYEAVEVDTATGELIRSLGQVATAEDVETAECAACVNAIDAVWRTFDGSHIFISECCEPAAGLIHVLTDDELPLLAESGRDSPWFFWWATPAPDSPLVAFLGYQVLVTAADVAPPNGDAGAAGTWMVTENLDTFPISNAVWAPGENAIRWLEGDGEAVRLRTFDTSGGSTAIPIDELAGWALAGLAGRATGELVVARAQPDGVTTSLLVFTPEGDLVDEVPIEPGARLGGYDRTGTFLIYTADDGVARWIGGGTSGLLGEGFVHASW
jgi:hypothetical protein